MSDEAGAPLAGTTFYYHFLPSYGRERSLTESAADGSFAIASFPALNQYLCVAHEGYAPATVLVPADWDREEPLAIKLGKGGTLKISAEVPEGAKAMVSVSSTTPFLGYSVWQELPANNELELAEVPEGSYEVGVMLSTSMRDFGRTNLKRKLELGSGKEHLIAFPLPDQSAALSGTIDCASLLPSSVLITLTYPDSSLEREDSVLAHYDGTYALENLQPGAAVLKATVTLQDGSEKVLETDLQLRPDEEKVLDLKVE